MYVCVYVCAYARVHVSPLSLHFEPWSREAVDAEGVRLRPGQGDWELRAP